MATTCKQFAQIILAFALVGSSIVSHAQSTTLDPEKWANELSKEGREGNESYKTIDSILQNLDSARTFEFLNKLSDKGKKTYQFQARFILLKAHQICLIRFQILGRLSNEVLARKAEIQNMLANAMDLAYQSEDDHLIALVSSGYGQLMIHFGEIGLAVMYSMNSIDLGEKISYKITPYDYQFLAEMLYKVREYNSSIKYARKAADAWKNSSGEMSRRFRVSCVNTVALGFHRQNQYDSALFYYSQALRLAKQTNAPVWIGIVSGNMAQIYYVQKTI